VNQHHVLPQVWGQIDDVKIQFLCEVAGQRQVSVADFFQKLPIDKHNPVIIMYYKGMVMHDLLDLLDPLPNPPPAIQKSAREMYRKAIQRYERIPNEPVVKRKRVVIRRGHPDASAPESRYKSEQREPELRRARERRLREEAREQRRAERERARGSQDDEEEEDSLDDEVSYVDESDLDEMDWEWEVPDVWENMSIEDAQVSIAKLAHLLDQKWDVNVKILVQLMKDNVRTVWSKFDLITREHLELSLDKTLKMYYKKPLWSCLVDAFASFMLKNDTLVIRHASIPVQARTAYSRQTNLALSALIDELNIVSSQFK
jgi:hypothetical protein